MGIENEIITAMETEQEGFVIDSDQKASWALKVIKAETDEAGRLMQIADSQIEELVNKKMEIKEKLDRKTGYLKGLLYRYFETVEKKETKTQQSYKLLDGTLTYKKPSVKILKPEDEIGSQALLEYLEQNQPEMIETIKKPAWGEFKKNLTITDDGGVVDMATGEKLDFIQAEEEPGKFDVKL